MATLLCALTTKGNINMSETINIYILYTLRRAGDFLVQITNTYNSTSFGNDFTLFGNDHKIPPIIVLYSKYLITKFIPMLVMV